MWRNERLHESNAKISRQERSNRLPLITKRVKEGSVVSCCTISCHFSLYLKQHALPSVCAMHAYYHSLVSRVVEHKLLK